MMMQIMPHAALEERVGEPKSAAKSEKRPAREEGQQVTFFLLELGQRRHSAG